MTSYVDDHSSYPYSAVTYIESTFQDGQTSSGSGVVVGENDVLTASHVIYSENDGGLASSIEVYPGRDGINTPYGPFHAEQAQYYEVDKDGDGQLTQSETENDLALLGFETVFGEETGWFDLPSDASSGDYNLTGYPGEYADNSPRMTNDTGYVTEDSYSDVWDIGALEVNPGNSGGPLWNSNDGEASVLGIVSTDSWAVDLTSQNMTISNWIEDNNSLISNSPPQGMDDGAKTQAGEKVVIDVLANDSDPDGDDLTLISVSDPENGDAWITQDSRIAYSPYSAYSGTDNFTYTISDGNEGTDTANVTITIKGEAMTNGDINFNTGLEISVGTPFSELFADVEEKYSHYEIWTGQMQRGDVLDGNFVGKVSAENLADLTVSYDQLNHNTMYVRGWEGDDPGDWHSNAWKDEDYFDFPGPPGIDFHTDVEISLDTSFGELFTDQDDTTTWYQLYTAKTDEDGNVVEGSFVETEEGKGWVSKEDLDDLEVTGDQAGHNTIYVQPYSPELGMRDWQSNDWQNGNLFDFPEPWPYELTIEQSSVTADTPLDQMFSFTAPSGVDKDEIWFKVQIDGEGLDTELGGGWVRGDNLASEEFPASDVGKEMSVTPYYEGEMHQNDERSWKIFENTLNIANDVSVTEGNTDTTTAEFTVSLDQAAVQEVTVDYATSDGTATAGDDYKSASGELTFSPNETEKTIGVDVYGDTKVEEDETFNLELRNPTNADLGNSTTTGTIVNDDQAATEAELSLSSFSVEDVDVGESFSVEVDISETAGVETGNLTVNLAIEGAGINKTVDVDSLQGEQDTVIFEELVIENAGEYTAEITAYADNANEVQTSQTLTVDLLDPGLALENLDWTTADLEVGDEFSVSGTVSAQNGERADAQNVQVGLEIANGQGEVVDEFSVGDIAAGGSEDFDLSWSADEAGDYTAQLVADADNANEVQASETFEVVESGPPGDTDYIVTDYDSFQAALDDSEGRAGDELVIEVADDIDDFPASQLTYEGETDLVIRGQDGHNYTLDAEGYSRILKLGPDIPYGPDGPSVKIENLNFVDGNAGDEDGGAINTPGSPSSLEVYDSNFTNNTGENGGAIEARTELVINDTEFVDNTAKSMGGAISYSTQLKSHIRDSVFKDNTATKNGGAISTSNTDLLVDDTKFIENIAQSHGAAIDSYENTLLIGSTFHENEGVTVVYGEDIVLSKNEFSNNSVKESWEIVDTGNVGENPGDIGDAGGNEFISNDEPLWTSITLYDLNGSPATIDGENELLFDSTEQNSNANIENYSADSELILMGDGLSKDDVQLQDSSDGEDLEVSMNNTEITLIGLGGMGFSSVEEFNNSSLGNISVGLEDWLF